MAAIWPNNDRIMRDIWTDDTLAKEPYLGESVLIPTTGPMPKYVPPKLTRRQRAKPRVDHARTRVALVIAPWLDYHDEDW